MDLISICGKLQNNSEFNSLKSKEEKVKYMLTTFPTTKKLQDYISKSAQIYSNSHRKSQTRFRYHLKLGSKQFQENNYESAISSYTKAIMNCKFPLESVSNQLAICYALRSRVYYRVNQIKHSLFDANRAFDLYPTLKMLRQRINCLLLLRRKCEAIDAIDSESHFWLSEDTIIRQYLTAIKQNIVSNHKDIKIESELCENRESIENTDDSMIKSYVDDCYLMTTSEEKGRCVVAKDDVLTNAVLVDEEPLAISLFERHFSKMCCNCLKAVDHRFYPCQWCNEVVFCSEKCPKFNYHMFECGIAGLLEQTGHSFYLVYRLMTRIGCETAIDLNEKHKTKSCTQVVLFDSYKNTEKSMSEVYRSFLNLLTHRKEMKDAMKTFTYVVALHVTLFLRHTKAFVCDNRELSKYIAFTSLIHSNILRIYVNCFGVFLRRNGKHDHIGNCLVYYGAYFSHSCDPNVRWIWNHNTSSLAFRAMRTIRKSEELCITYGPTYRTLHIANRKNILLSKYHFDCHCHACVNETSNASAFKCLKCVNGVVKYEQTSKSAKCFACNQCYVNIEKLVSRVQKWKTIINAMIANIEQKVNIDLSLSTAEKVMTKWSKIAIQTCAHVIDTKKQLWTLCIKINRFDYAIKFQ